MRELEDMNNLRADFDLALSQDREDDCRAMVDQMGESYSELEAMKMHREANRRFSPEPQDPWIADQERGQNIDSHIWSSHY